ncbi:metallopeptidase TldD-related protein [Pectobacterium polonicum]|uniref:metallopeptidase TldD-related protein n=1 Tax=Pectobacterium polonicum TaxID=2485124 RepID=UPI002B25507B|nr:metallopeptidase TldD-related protein [Pectobacterium polonicum]
MPSLDESPVLATPQSGTLQSLAGNVLDLAAAKGASQAVVNVSQGNRRTIRVRKGDMDTLTQNQSQFLSVTVYFGQRSGTVSSTLFSQEALQDAVDAASTLAKYADEDACSGLPEAQYFARDIYDLKLHHDDTLTVEQALSLALRAEQAANTAHEHSYNESTEITSQQGDFILANSAGFCAGYPTSLHTLWSQAIARDDTARQKGFWHTTGRSPAFLATPETVGHTAAQRAIAQLKAHKLSTRRCPVLFEAPVAHSLIHHLVNALSGQSLYHTTSFLGRCQGDTITSPHLSLHENPFIPGALASACFDTEGVAASARHAILNGVAQGYFLSNYSAKRLGLSPTGHAGGAYNLSLSSSLTHPGDDLPTLLRTMQTGLLVTTLLGHGLNPMTGDYSQGVAGFWVENGEIQYPVDEITIAGNLKTLLLQCVALGADIHTQGNLSCGSLLIEEMQIAGQ